MGGWANWEDADLQDLPQEAAKGFHKSLELKSEHKSSESCLWRLEAIFYAVSPLCNTGFQQ